MTKTALVTGGGSGIGQACAVTLAQNGFTVAVTGRRKDALEETVARMGGGVAIPADITSAAEVDALFEQV